VIELRDGVSCLNERQIVIIDKRLQIIVESFAFAEELIVYLDDVLDTCRGPEHLSEMLVDLETRLFHFIKFK